MRAATAESARTSSSRIKVTLPRASHNNNTTNTSRQIQASPRGYKMRYSSLVILARLKTVAGNLRAQGPPPFFHHNIAIICLDSYKDENPASVEPAGPSNSPAPPERDSASAHDN